MKKIKEQKFKTNPYTNVEIKILPSNIEKGDILYECGCVKRNGIIYYRIETDCFYHPNEELK